MSSSTSSRFRDRLPLYMSLAMHGLVAALVVPVGMHMKAKIAPPADEVNIAMLEVAGGSSLARSPLLMAPMGDRKSEKVLAAPRPANSHAALQKQRLPKASGSEAQTARAQDRGTSSAAGNGSDARDATFAFPIFSPRPPVTDRNLLPSSDRKVVVDVKLSASGEVIGETLVTGIGSVLDQMAMDAVKSWRFQPATVNQQAVPSEAEVIFTFGPHYPVLG